MHGDRRISAGVYGGHVDRVGDLAVGAAERVGVDPVVVGVVTPAAHLVEPLPHDRVRQAVLVERSGFAIGVGPVRHERLERCDGGGADVAVVAVAVAAVEREDHVRADLLEVLEDLDGELGDVDAAECVGVERSGEVGVAVVEQHDVVGPEEVRGGPDLELAQRAERDAGGDHVGRVAGNLLWVARRW